MISIHVPNSMIVQNPYQRRVEYGDIAELAEQIATAYEQYPESRGVMQVPRARLVDRTTGDVVALKGMKGLSEGATLPKAYQSNYRIELMYGHRRLEALRYLQEHDERYKDGLVFISLTLATDEQMLDAVWAENAQRRNLSAVEEARLMSDALDALSNGSKYTQSALAKRWGLAQPTIANRLRLLKLPEEIQVANQTGVISERVALGLLDVQRFIDSKYKFESWEETAEQVMDFALSGKWTSVEVRRWIERRLASAPIVTETLLNEEITVPYTVQKSCKRCEFNLRANGEGRCINSPCYQAKQRYLATRRAVEVANELCIEYQHDSYIEEEIQRWSRQYQHPQLLLKGLTQHFDAVAEHIIITAQLDHKYINLPSYTKDGTWTLGNGGRYSLVIVSRLSFDEFAELLPQSEPEDEKVIEVDLDIQPLGKRFSWYEEQYKSAWDTAGAGIEGVIVELTDGLPPATVALLCRVVDVSVSSDSSVNEARLATGIYQMWNKSPIWIADRLGVEPVWLDRSHVEALTITTMTNYIDETMRLGPMTYDARRYGEQLALCQSYCDFYNVRGDLYKDLLVAIQQCDEVLS